MDDFLFLRGIGSEWTEKKKKIHLIITDSTSSSGRQPLYVHKGTKKNNIFLLLYDQLLERERKKMSLHVDRCWPTPETSNNNISFSPSSSLPIFVCVCVFALGKQKAEKKRAMGIHKVYSFGL